MSDESEAQGSSQYSSGYGSSEIVVVNSDDTSDAYGNLNTVLLSDNSDWLADTSCLVKWTCYTISSEKKLFQLQVYCEECMCFREIANELLVK